MGADSSEWRIAGVDEAGRGPLAGPVVAAAVILPRRYCLRGLGDSKKLTRRQRERLEKEIKCQALCWAIGEASALEIDTVNILQATLLAMSRAVRALEERPYVTLIDGCHAPDVDGPSRTVVRGDANIPQISAASILAKVYRDRIMIRLHDRYPVYGFATNMGYPTSRHLQALLRYGPSEIHRRTFAPVRSAIRDTEERSI